ncbi:MAG: DUF58 domain-containing protein [Ruminococcus sp.]|nr:DUF58 domain-containing protein [Ruminococcus sp.]
MFLIKLLFAVLIIVCAVFYILYIWDFSLVLLVVMTALPVLMLISMLIARKSISVEFAVKSSAVAKNEIFDIQLCVTNKSIFPIGKAEAFIEYYNIFNNQINSIELHFPIQSRNSQRVTFQLNSKFCGTLIIRSAYINIFDPLRIFRFKIGKNISETITVLPQGYDINGTVSYTDRVNDESLNFSETKPGDDPSEVFDLREYTPGDKPNRIHWKLSSKKDDFIVKEYSCPIDSPTAVFLDLRCKDFSEFTLPVYDTLIETMVSLCQLLLENERVHTIIYYNCREKCFVQREINDINALSSSVKELLESVDDNLAFNSPEEFLSDFGFDGWSSFSFITTADDLEMLSLFNDYIDADIKNFFTVVRDKSVSDMLSEHQAFNITPVIIGKISSSIKDTEL